MYFWNLKDKANFMI